MKVKVRCSFVIEVEIADDLDPKFVIEENGCPGTGIVGSTLDAHMDKCDVDGVCWACALQGKNEIID